MKATNLQKRLMITGCGRSGTRYITFLLRRLGLEIGHETMKKDGIASWCTAFGSDQTPWGESVREYNFDQIFHQIRHPLKVIPSTCSFKDTSWQYICNRIPCCIDEPVMLRSAKYWYYWNIEAEKISQWRYKIEDLVDIFDEFCLRLGVRADRSVLDRTPVDINTRQHGRLIHLFDELMEQLSLNSSTFFRKKLKATPVDDARGKFTWDALRSLDCEIHWKIREKAREYGYDN